MHISKFLNYLLIVLLIFCIYRYVEQYHTPLSKASLSTTVATVFIALCISGFQYVKDINIRGNILSIFTIFLLGFVIVHFFRYLGLILGVYDDIIDVSYIDSSFVNGAAICSCSAMISFLIGYFHEDKGFNSNRLGISKINPHIIVGLMYLLLFIFVFSVGFKYFLNGSGAMMNSREGVPLLGQLAPIWLLACNVVLSMNIIIQYRPKRFFEYYRLYPTSYYILVFVYLILVILSGDRGPIFHFGLCYIFTYFISSRKQIKRYTALLLLTIAVASFSLLGTIRALDSPISRGSINEAIDTRNERYNDINPIFSSTEELSNIVRSYHVIYYIGADVQSFYGLGFVNEALGIIPGLRFFLYPILGIDDNLLKTSSITTAYMGKDHGMGTSCVGDTFINLGFYGTIIFFFFFGMIVKKMDISQKSNASHIHPFYLSLILSYSLYSIYLCRSTLFTPINLTVYSFVIYYIFRKPVHNETA